MTSLISNSLLPFLISKNKLVIDNVGTIVLTRQSANIDKAQQMINAPKSLLLFETNQEITSNDFVQYVAEKENLPISSVAKQWQNILKDIHDNLNKHFKYTLQPLGTFSKNQEGIIVFESDEIFSKNFGLSALPLPKANKIKQKNKKSFWSFLLKFLLIILIIKIIAIFALYFVNYNLLKHWIQCASDLSNINLNVILEVLDKHLKNR